jgi:hypothetical protein
MTAVGMSLLLIHGDFLSVTPWTPRAGTSVAVVSPDESQPSDAGPDSGDPFGAPKYRAVSRNTLVAQNTGLVARNTGLVARNIGLPLGYIATACRFIC